MPRDLCYSPAVECLDERDALAMLDGDVPDRGALDAHLDSCPWCRRLVAEIGRSEGTRPATVADGELERGTTIGRFTIERELGSGATGVVYAAHDPELDRRVALKLLHAADDGELEARLLREARTMAKLSHPNLVPVFEVSRCDDGLVIAMELVEGGTLREWLAAAPRNARDVLAVCLAAGRGLAAAHAAGLVHRDFKPENVLVGGDGRARVTDFGLARAAASHEAAPAGTTPASPLTRSGVVVGTPAYMAPEQIAGGLVDARSDQFSFCITLYEALCGRRPFAGATLAALAESIKRGELPASPTPPRRLRRVLERGLSADPAARWPTMDAMIARCERRSRVGTIAAVGAVAAIAIVGFLAMRGTSPPACSDGTKELAGIWDDGRRGALAFGFATSGSPIAAESFDHATAALDRYAGAWVFARADSCAATKIRGDASDALLDRRMSCLADRKDELGALVGLLAHADAREVARAPLAVAALVAPATCTTPDATDDPPPFAGSARDQADALRAELHRATALADLGRTDEADAILDPIVARAGTLGLPRLRAAALFRRGLDRILTRDQRGTADLEDAAYAAQATKLDQLDALATTAVIAAATDAGDLGRARAWVRFAQAAVERVGGSVAHANLAANVAWLDLHDGKLADAEALARTAAADGCRGIARSVSCAHLNVLATVLFVEGKVADALAVYDDNLALSEAELGPAHPDVGRALERSAAALDKLGRHADALARFDRAMAILGPAPTAELATLLDNSGTALMSLGRNAEAEARMRRALAIHERVQGADHPDTATTLVNLANVLDREGKGTDSLALRERALHALEARLGPDAPLVASTLVSMAYQLTAAHHPRDAEPLLERALAIQIQRLGEGHPDTAYTLALLGSAQLDAHEPAKAVATLTRALATAQPAARADIQQNLADAIRQTGGNHAR